MFEETWDFQRFSKGIWSKPTADFHGKPTFEAFGFYLPDQHATSSQPASPPCCAVPTVEEAITARQNAIDFAPTGPPLLMTFCPSFLFGFRMKGGNFPIWKLNVQTGKSRMFFKDPFPKQKHKLWQILMVLNSSSAGKKCPPPSAQELRKNKTDETKSGGGKHLLSWSNGQQTFNVYSTNMKWNLLSHALCEVCIVWHIVCCLHKATAPPKSWIERNGSWNIWKAFSGCVINCHSYYMFPVTYFSTIEKALLFFGGWFKAANVNTDIHWCNKLEDLMLKT